jgi:hypothetical protein
MVFSLFCFFCIFAQGFSLKMQLVEQKTWFWTRFITFLESKTLKTLILDRFLSENTIKPMLLQHFAFSLTEVSSKGSHWGSKRGIHRNTQKAWSKFIVSRPATARAICNSLGFFHESPKKCTVLNIRNIFLWKNKWFFHPIHISRYKSNITGKMYWIHISRYKSNITGKMYWIHISRYKSNITGKMYWIHISRYEHLQ